VTDIVYSGTIVFPAAGRWRVELSGVEIQNPRPVVNVIGP
jgi:hypothetical protein